MSVIHVKERIGRAEPYVAQAEHTRPPLRSFNVREYLELEIPSREMLLSPILPAQGLVMLYAPRGIGKTHVALWMAYTIACGGEMFSNKWQCERPSKVLFLDGEMPARTLQERLCSTVASCDKEVEDVQNLKIITPDFQEAGIPDLCTPSGQEWLEPHLKDINLLIIDNLSSLCRSGRENESESWNPLQGGFCICADGAFPFFLFITRAREEISEGPGTKAIKRGTETYKSVPFCSTVCGTEDEGNNLLYEYNERLAITEHDGGQTPLQAHRTAYLDSFLSILFDLSALDPQRDWLAQRVQSALTTLESHSFPPQHQT